MGEIDFERILSQPSARELLRQRLKIDLFDTTAAQQQQQVSYVYKRMSILD